MIQAARILRVIIPVAYRTPLTVLLFFLWILSIDSKCDSIFLSRSSTFISSCVVIVYSFKFIPKSLLINFIEFLFFILRKSTSRISLILLREYKLASTSSFSILCIVLTEIFVSSESSCCVRPFWTLTSLLQYLDA